jgi:hypothetical protein
MTVACCWDSLPIKSCTAEESWLAKPISPPWGTFEGAVAERWATEETAEGDLCSLLHSESNSIGNMTLEELFEPTLT